MLKKKKELFTPVGMIVVGIICLFLLGSDGIHYFTASENHVVTATFSEEMSPYYSQKDTKTKYQATWVYTINGEPYTVTSRESSKPKENATKELCIYKNKEGKFIVASVNGSLGLLSGILGPIALIAVGIIMLVEQIKKKKKQ